MSKRHSPEQIIRKLRKAENGSGQVENWKDDELLSNPGKDFRVAAQSDDCIVFDLK